MKLNLIHTADGSHTLFLPELNEQYHSVNGAITESKHIFIDAAFNYFTGNSPVVFEVGFGTGLNCLLTALESAKKGKITNYYSIEKYPLEREIIDQLNYGEILSEEAQILFQKIHECEWNKMVRITENFYLEKISNDLLEIELTALPKFNIIYFDAFGPDKQPQLWTIPIFQKIYAQTEHNGIFVTYSAKGEVRRNLMSCGYTMERLPGPPGKKQMLRGIKKDSRD